MGNDRPSIDRYNDYRAYLSDLIQWHREESDSFSYRVLADAAGFGSKSFVKRVVDGERNLGNDSVEPLANALGLTEREGRVFAALVSFNQARNDDEAQAAFADVLRLRRDPTASMERAHYDAFSRWFPLVIRELIDMPGFNEDAAWIGRRLRPKIAAKSVAAALRLLESLGLVRRDEDEQLHIQERALSTGPQVDALIIRTFHRQMLELAIDALDGIPRSERNITGLMLPLTSDQYDRLCALLGEFRAEVRERFETDATPPDGDETFEIYQLLLSLVPLTKQVR